MAKSNKTGAVSLSISTIVIIALGLIVLVALILFFTGSFERFGSGIDPIIDVSVSSADIQACAIACQQENDYYFCCNKFEEGGVDCNSKQIFERLECTLSCEDVICE